MPTWRHNSCLISNFLENEYTDGSDSIAAYSKPSFGKQQNPTACYLPEVYFKFSHPAESGRMQKKKNAGKIASKA